MTSDPRYWRDFLATLDVVIASALAREDMRDTQTAQQPAFAFQLLAAADDKEPRLPAGTWSDAQRLLTATLAEQATGELRLTLRASGYAALTRVGGRSARIVSTDGRIAIAFRFDAHGEAVVPLADTPGIRQALADFNVLLA